MKRTILLLALCGCSTNTIATDCIPVVPWTLEQEHSVLVVQQQAHSSILNAFLMDYGNMRQRARRQPCNLSGVRP